MLCVRNIIFFTALLFCCPLLAQEQEVELDPVTITSSLSSVISSKTGRNVIVIKGEEFSKFPVHSVDELLRYVPGIEIQARGPMGAQSDIALRGSTFQQVLVLIDGVRVNEPLTGHLNSYIPIAPNEIDRVEILKGASSAIYGSDAVGGVINIITKSFSKQSKSYQQVSVQLTAGEYDLLNAQAGGFYTDGKTSIGAGFLTNNSKGQLQRGTRGFFNLNTGSISLNHQLTDNWQIGFRSAIDSRKFAAQNFYTTLKIDTADEKIQTSWNQLRVSYQKGANAFSLSSGYKKVDDEYQLNKVFSPNFNRSKLFQSLAVYEHQFNEQSTLITGGQFQNRDIRSNDRGNHSINQAAAFAILQQAISRSFSISPALRFDWHQTGGTELVPQLNLSYKINQFQLRGSVGKTIRYADFTEQYNNYNKPPYVSAGNRIGNPDLSAETSWNYEGGVDVFLTNNLKISATYFRRDHEGLIDYISTPYSDMPRKSNLSPTGNFFLAKNVAEVNTTGFETDILYRQNIGKSLLSGSAGLVWVHSENDLIVPSLYLTSYARFLTNFKISFATPWFSVNVNGLYKQRDKQKKVTDATNISADLSHDYFVMNGKLEGFLIKNKLGAFLEVDNIWDRSYSDILGTVMPGRWFMGGLKLSLSK